jgi:hypothetical protein
MTTAENEVKPDAAPKKVKQTAEEKAAIKATKDAEKAAAKAKKDAEKPAKVEPKAKDVKNGVNRPATGVTKLVWDTADALSMVPDAEGNKAPTERAPLVEALKGKVEVGTIHTQYGRWRKYYGLTETKEQRQTRLAAARADKDAKKAEAKKVKDAEKAIKAAEKAAADKVKADAKAAAEQAAEAAKQAEQAQPETAATE